MTSTYTITVDDRYIMQHLMVLRDALENFNDIDGTLDAMAEIAGQMTAYLKPDAHQNFLSVLDGELEMSNIDDLRKYIHVVLSRLLQLDKLAEEYQNTHRDDETAD